jgi:hypothetical protein
VPGKIFGAVGERGGADLVERREVAVVADGRIVAAHQGLVLLQGHVALPSFTVVAVTAERHPDYSTRPRSANGVDVHSGRLLDRDSDGVSLTVPGSFPAVNRASC